MKPEDVSGWVPEVKHGTLLERPANRQIFFCNIVLINYFLISEICLKNEKKKFS